MATIRARIVAATAQSQIAIVVVMRRARALRLRRTLIHQ